MRSNVLKNDHMSVNLRKKYRFWVSDEYFRFAYLVLVISYVVISENSSTSRNVVSFPNALGSIRTLFGDQVVPFFYYCYFGLSLVKGSDANGNKTKKYLSMNLLNVARYAKPARRTFKLSNKPKYTICHIIGKLC